MHAATLSALRLAAENDIQSIALPALGTGVGGLSLAACAKQMLSATGEHIRSNELPAEIRFVLYGQNALEAFNEALES